MTKRGKKIRANELSFQDRPVSFCSSRTKRMFETQIKDIDVFAQCRYCGDFMVGIHDLNLRFYCYSCCQDQKIKDEDNGRKRRLRIAIW